MGVTVPDEWYYSDQAGSFGPFTLEALKLALNARPDSNDVLVWPAGLLERRKPSDVPVLERLEVVDGRVVVKSQAAGASAVNWGGALFFILIIIPLWGPVLTKYLPPGTDLNPWHPGLFA